MDISEWSGIVQGQRLPPVSLDLVMPLQASTSGGSGTFLARCSDAGHWWVKPSNSPQGRRVMITEHIVGRVAELISAPVCQVTVINVPPSIAGWEYRPGQKLESGPMHGSAHVADCLERRDLAERVRDDNPVRHVGIFALYDWCWGGDAQWLYSETQDRRLYSHDHGWYLPEEGPDWSIATLQSRVGESHPLGADRTGLSAPAIESVAKALEAITRDQLADILRRVPIDWPVSDAELEAVGWFLEARASQVAGRIRANLGGRP